jgi:uncharacterized protein
VHYIDPHIHMISRTTDDYQRMAYAQCAAISEPAFWAGFDRGSAQGFHDYFRHLTEFEPKRIAMIPEFLNRPGVLGIGEIGLNKNTRNEATIFQEHLDLAAKTDELILIHTPHLEDKYKGTRMIVDMLKGDSRIKPHRVCVDHVEEHTVRLALDNGFWCGMTLYPTTKCTPARACDIIELVGTERIMANSAGDWGKSDPLAVPELIQEMKRRGHSPADIKKVVFDNPLSFWKQANNWKEWPPEPSATGVAKAATAKVGY